MKKIMLYLSFIVGSLSNVNCQVTFNHLIDFELPFSTLTSVLPTDSCYYATGVIVDSVPPFPVGNIFVKFDLEGNVEFSKVLATPFR